MKTYHLKLTALSPIHIGTGEDYEPTNYIIDADQIRLKDGRTANRYFLFEFNEFDFYKALEPNKQNEFRSIVSNSKADARFKLYDFIYKNKEIAKKIFLSKTRVLPNVAEDYKEKIGKVVQKEGGGKSVFSKFEIAKTYASPNTHQATLLGSSLKGSISTAYQEALYKKSGNYEAVKKEMLTPSDSNLFKDFIISDALPVKQGTLIDYAVNKKRAKETKSEMRTILESIVPTSEFKTTVVCKSDKIDFDKIAKSCNDHYMPIFQSQFDTQSDEFAKQALDEKFKDKYENWHPAKNQFLIRVGKHSGARAVTVDGIRSIKIMTGRGKQPKYEDEETTIWLTYDYPFGWLLCEIME